MSTEMVKKVCIVNGSLRGKQAASLAFRRDLDRRLATDRFHTSYVTVRARLKERYSEDTLRCIAAADALVFIFPLHNYGLPGALMRLLEDYYAYLNTGKEHTPANVYVIVNCAFPRPEATTGEALRVMRNFCARLSLNWRFAVCIGTGPVVVLTRKMPFVYPQLKRAYRAIASDIASGDRQPLRDYMVKPIIPEGIIAMIKRHYERSGRMIENRAQSR